ncbi:ccr4-not complex component [Moniliophthora roreri]|nr:ccr4-not complex component [Moniliophthora roreri]
MAETFNLPASTSEVMRGELVKLPITMADAFASKEGDAREVRLVFNFNTAGVSASLSTPVTRSKSLAKASAAICTPGKSCASTMIVGVASSFSAPGEESNVMIRGSSSALTGAAPDTRARIATAFGVESILITKEQLVILLHLLLISSTHPTNNTTTTSCFTLLARLFADTAQFPVPRYSRRR